ncbi:ArsR/SmtB family transcription factor [Staphylococcus simulans]
MIHKTLQLFNDGTQFLNVLQDQRRQELLVLLCTKGPLTVNQLTEHVTISRPAVSHHLKLMLEAGVLSVEQKGLERYYQSNLGPTLDWLKALTASLEDDLTR